MEIKVINQDKNELEFEVLGQSHTFCNLLRDFLWKNSDVEVSAYKIEHPLTSNPTMFIKTKKSSPQKALQETITSLKKMFADLEKEVLSELK